MSQAARRFHFMQLDDCAAHWCQIVRHQVHLAELQTVAGALLHALSKNSLLVRLQHAMVRTTCLLLMQLCCLHGEAIVKQLSSNQQCLRVNLVNPLVVMLVLGISLVYLPVRPELRGMRLWPQPRSPVSSPLPCACPPLRVAFCFLFVAAACANVLLPLPHTLAPDSSQHYPPPLGQSVTPSRTLGYLSD
jgi:hypothetical protein